MTSDLPTTPLRTLLVDDHQLIRLGMRCCLTTDPGLIIVGEAEDGAQAVKCCEQLKPDLVLMDVCMPELNGVDALLRIAARHARIKTILLNENADLLWIRAALRAGAWGCLLKSVTGRELLQAIHCVGAGQRYFSPAIASLIIDEYRDLQTRENSGESLLTPKERELLQHLAEGRNTKEIAGRLRLSTKTVDVYRRRLMARLRLRSLSQLTKYAIRIGLTSLEP